MNLSTPRLLLKPFTSKELNELFADCSKEEIMRALGYSDDREYEKQLKKYEEGYEIGKRPFINFQLVLKDTDVIIGYCGLHNWFHEHFRAEAGYHIQDAYKQQGFMFEALQAVLGYGFKILQLNRVEACTAVDNTASISLLLKSGFKKEGTMREHYFMNGVWYDSELFALLRNDFLSAQ